MKYFFIVQGEGMGHTTQSIALRAILEKNGHTVETTLLGTNFFRPRNPLYNSIRHRLFFSPVLLHARGKRGINLFLTFIYNLLLIPVYIFTVLWIACQVRFSNVHAIVVFYDVTAQLGTLLSFTGKPVLSVSHHYFFEHPAFRWPSDRKAERIMLTFHSWLASLGVKKKLSISFTEESSIPGKKLFIVPPLLRSEILDAVSLRGNHIHIYSLQPGFLRSVIMLAVRNPQTLFRVFITKYNKNIELPSNMTVSLISGDEFTNSLLSASMVLCTAGFETPCEAAYLNKPLIVVPSENHFEQYCNSLDIMRAGIGRAEPGFNVAVLQQTEGNPVHSEFTEWVKKGEEIFIRNLED